MSWWTEARVYELRGLVAVGVTSQEIAARLGTTRYSVLGKCRRLGLELNHKPRCDRPIWSKEREHRLRQLTNGYHTAVQIACALGLSVPSVKAKCRRLGISHRLRLGRERPARDRDGPIRWRDAPAIDFSGENVEPRPAIGRTPAQPATQVMTEGWAL